MKELLRLIKNAENVAILGHMSEDADSVGSSFAMQRVFSLMGKSADVYFSAPLEKRLGFMNVSGKCSAKAECEYDLCLCLDCADIERLGERKAIFDSAKKTASVDHHITNTNFADANFVLPDASATGEVLFDVIKKLGVKIDKELAECLFIAIASDTGSFKYSNVSPKTLRIAAELLETGIDNAYISRMLFDTEDEKSMKLKGALMSSVETMFDGKLAMICVDIDKLKEYDVEEKDLSDIVNIARMVAGCEIAVSVRELEDKVKLSFRSNGKYDVGSLAQKFGGGGHKMASGASSDVLTFAEMKKKVIDICGELFND